jgi:hypothetical protein
MIRVSAIGAVAGLLCAGAILSTAFAQQEAAKDTLPNFRPGPDVGWIAKGPNFQLPASGPHHVTQDPAYPYQPAGGGEARTFRVADLTNPILQPWAKDELRKLNESIIAGAPGYTRQVSCWPMGTPAFLLYPVAPIYFIQTPKEVLIMTQLNQEVRHIYMNVFHSEHVKPSWYGESVGHYEGHTLVVDTIGMNNQTFVDNFRTPHSDKLHTIERFRIGDDGKSMEVDLHVEDPGAFTTPWNSVQRYARAEQERNEVVCAENTTRIGGIEPLPVADKPDF